MLIFRGCTTESKFYISIYIYIYYCENLKNLIFLQLNFLGVLQVSPSKKVHFHVKVTHKKFGDILLIFTGCTTESKLYIYITVRIKKIGLFVQLNFFGNKVHQTLTKLFLFNTPIQSLLQFKKFLR